MREKKTLAVKNNLNLYSLVNTLLA